ncbi:hypothetical protein ABW16_13955 [Mycolicibacter heraklionensis]|uniref:PEP-CTERM sorting domain-containing protein n=1 Tax=Mycolicibacter heraklionensis TaxID=512402 RepID=A0ABR5FDV8_9MYCO|nr:hypothetical protein [Mycolicibacter heraklionensis]KLO28046.1 hypothetical protein ABW16_13955 [Mycolicibacter heraklionensis]
MRTTQHRIVPALGAAAGALLTAGFLPVGVAWADEIYFVPDPSTLHPSQVAGNAPYSPAVVSGTEVWHPYDVDTQSIDYNTTLNGLDTHTASVFFTNDILAMDGFTVDLMNFGGGWENEWLETPLTDVGGADLLITPFGDFQLWGPADAFTT